MTVTVVVLFGVTCAWLAWAWRDYRRMIKRSDEHIKQWTEDDI